MMLVVWWFDQSIRFYLCAQQRPVSQENKKGSLSRVAVQLGSLANDHVAEAADLPIEGC